MPFGDDADLDAGAIEPGSAREIGAGGRVPSVVTEPVRSRPGRTAWITRTTSSAAIAGTFSAGTHPSTRPCSSST